MDSWEHGGNDRKLSKRRLLTLVIEHPRSAGSVSAAVAHWLSLTVSDEDRATLRSPVVDSYDQVAAVTSEQETPPIRRQ